MPREKEQRIGIYAGTFDPVHAGHIAFALQAQKATKLDKVYLVPERQPRGKRHVTHFAHRVAMIRRATKPYASITALELEDKSFTIDHTLPRLKQRFPQSRLVFMCGSDVLSHMPDWPRIEQLLLSVELVIGKREQETQAIIQNAVNHLPTKPLAVTIVQTHAADVSSSQVRQALRERRGVHGLLASVRAYAGQEWLYL